MKVEGDRAGEAMEMIANLFDLLEQHESQSVEIACLKQSLERIEKTIQEEKYNIEIEQAKMKQSMEADFYAQTKYFSEVCVDFYSNHAELFEKPDYRGVKST